MVSFPGLVIAVAFGGLSTHHVWMGERKQKNEGKNCLMARLPNDSARYRMGKDVYSVDFNC
jgi:hypothetical protein